MQTVTHLSNVQKMSIQDNSIQQRLISACSFMQSDQSLVGLEFNGPTNTIKVISNRSVT